MEVNGTLCARCLLVSSLASPTGAHRKGILRSAAATSGNTDMKGRTSERKRKPPAIVTVVCNGFVEGKVCCLSLAAGESSAWLRSPSQGKKCISIELATARRPPATGRARSSWPRMAAQGATLQNYNLVKCVDDLKEKREEVNKSTRAPAV